MLLAIASGARPDIASTATARRSTAAETSSGAPSSRTMVSICSTNRRMRSQSARNAPLASPSGSSSMRAVSIASGVRNAWAASPTKRRWAASEPSIRSSAALTAPTNGDSSPGRPIIGRRTCGCSGPICAAAAEAWRSGRNPCRKVSTAMPTTSNAIGTRSHRALNRNSRNRLSTRPSCCSCACATTTRQGPWCSCTPSKPSGNSPLRGARKKPCHDGGAYGAIAAGASALELKATAPVGSYTTKKLLESLSRNATARGPLRSRRGLPSGPIETSEATSLAWLCSAASSSEPIVASVRHTTAAAASIMAIAITAARRQANRRDRRHSCWLFCGSE